MIYDALDREESCGGHFREEYQTKEGEALRDDENYNYDDIDGIYYLKDGEVATNKWRQFIPNIDEIPIPDYSDIDFQLYQQHNQK